MPEGSQYDGVVLCSSVTYNLEAVSFNVLLFFIAVYSSPPSVLVALPVLFSIPHHLLNNEALNYRHMMVPSSL